MVHLNRDVECHGSLGRLGWASYAPDAQPHQSDAVRTDRRTGNIAAIGTGGAPARATRSAPILHGPDTGRPEERLLRRRAYRRGTAAERIACWILRLFGYRVLARRFRTVAGEIDVVARRGRTLAFVEVKSRATAAEADDAVTDAGVRRIRAAADIFVARNPRFADHAMRFDMMTGRGGFRVRWLKNAF